MQPIRYTEEFNLAYRFVTETNLNIFLTGNAGTGKTTFLKYLRENSFKKMVVAAPTGVAAINAGGVTLHSLFQLPFSPFIPSKIISTDFGEQNVVNTHSLLAKLNYRKEKLNLLRNLELLIIDETSMVACHTIDAIDTILRTVRKRHDEPFGGVQVLFIGDLYQLPPVVKKQEWDMLKSYYSSIFFFDSIVLQENVPVMIELKEIFRQQDDQFIAILNGIRNNNITEENYKLLNSRLNFNYNTPENEGYITLTTHNYQSDEINRKKLNKLSFRSQLFKAEIEGLFPENLLPAEASLELKTGAQVMFLKNDNEGKKYFNGKIGTVTSLGSNSIRVKCKGESLEIEVKKYEWKNVNYSLNPNTHEIKEEVLGSFIQYPLRLAWAITIHKSQGLTFDKLIVDAENAFANGQVYVALSRCTSLDGLVLTSPVNRKYLGATATLREWQQRNHDEKNLHVKFSTSRQKYILRELNYIFNWQNWYLGMKGFNQHLLDHQDVFSPGCFSWLQDLMDKEKTLYEVASKFNGQIAEFFFHQEEMEKNQQLQKRLKDAANYFSMELMNWKEEFHHHPFSLDTKKLARETDEHLQDIDVSFHEVLFKIDYCKNGFILHDYLDKRKNFRGPSEQMKSSYAGNQKESFVSEEVEHQELFRKLSNWRRDLAAKERIPVYRVMRNQTFELICRYLPGTNNVLINIEGISKSKSKKYGDEIVKMVVRYCEEKNIQTLKVLKPEIIKKSDTVEETIRHFRDGKNIEQIAMERKLAVSTIESHLVQAIQQNAVEIEEIIPMDEVNRITAFFPENVDSVALTTIKVKSPEYVSFGKLRMVLAWMQKNKMNN